MLRAPGRRGTRIWYTLAADVYSTGMLLRAIATSEPPYEGMRTVDVLHAVTAGRTPPPLPASCPRDWDELVRLCLRHEPQRRPTIQTVLRMLDDCRLAGATPSARSV